MAYPVTEKYAKTFIRGKDIEPVLWRLLLLTKDEKRVTVAQNLDVVYGLVNIMLVVMEGAHRQFV